MTHRRQSPFYLLLLPAFLFCKLAEAQDSLQAKKITLSTSLIEYFPNPKLNTINFNLGAEIYVGNNTSIATNIGYLKSYGNIGYYPFQYDLGPTQGVKFRLEARRYLKIYKVIEPAMLLFWPHVFQYHSQKKANSGFYTGISSTYQITDTQRSELFIDDVSSTPLNTVYKTNSYTVLREVVGLNVMLGYQCFKKNNITVDYAVGFGLLYVTSRSKNKLENNPNTSNSYKDWPMNKDFDSGSGFCPNVLYQLRLGYAF